MIAETLDLSSNEPHITVDCPLCGYPEMVKADKLGGVTQCEHHIEYFMKPREDGMITVSYKLSMSLDEFEKLKP